MKGVNSMSYDGTVCPCGGKKLGNTMLCDDCILHFQQHPAMLDFKNGKLDVEVRRHAAITLLALCRDRKKRGWRG